MDIRNILTSTGLNTLTFSDPYAKLVFTSFAASKFRRTLYIDLDSTYSAYAKAGLISADGVDIYIPDNGRLMRCLAEVMSALEQRRHSLVILDSVSSFYALYYPETKNVGALNRLLYILVMLLVHSGVNLQVPVLITSMLRYRKDKGWVQSPAAKRLIESKSIVRLHSNGLKNGQVVEIEIHPFLKQGTKFEYEDITTWH